MLVEITTWKKIRKGKATVRRAVTFSVYLTEREVDAYGLSVQVVLCASDKYRLVRGLSFLQGHGLAGLAETIVAELHRQEAGGQA